MATSTIKKKRIVMFDLTTTLGNSFRGRGTYDPVSDSVRIVVRGASTSAINTSTPLFTIPSGYRPQQQYHGEALIRMSDNSFTQGDLHANTDGTIDQGTTNNLTMVFGYIEYPLHT